MRFNFFKRKDKVVANYEGAKAYLTTPETELYAAVVTASLSDSFYEKSGDRVERIGALIAKTDADFVAKLAVYTRKHMHMRSVPLVLAVELAKHNSGNGIVRKAVSGVVRRADEITELLAYYQTSNKREGTKKLNKLSKQVQKGLADSFNLFDEYQFAKYNKDTAIKLRDALFLVHPKAKDATQQLLFNKIAADELAIPYTWEIELSSLGQISCDSKEQKALAIKEKWEELIDSKKLGYMAMLRNLRNILQADVSYSHIKKVCDYLNNKEAVANSKQLPFRFLSAYRELQNVHSEYASTLLTALEKAIKISALNIAGFDERSSVLIACDVSGSMQNPISPRSTVQRFDIGILLGMLMHSKCSKVMTGMYGDTWKVINMPSNNILANTQEYHRREGEVGYATNGHKVIDDLISKNTRIDKIMMFTDCQLWDSNHGGNNLQKSWEIYKAMFPEAKLYLFDLAGYGNTPVDLKGNGVHLIAGWSDKIFDVLFAIENGGNIIDQIKAIEL